MKRFSFKDAIVFENDNYYAINKPAGISSLHERIGTAISVFEAAKRFNESLQLCHRLDKETSGVLLISKHAKAYSHAAVSFEKRKVKKIYHAVSEGVHSFSELELSLPLITTRSGRSAINSLKGKESKTVFNTIENYQHYSLVECQPLTGRLHQIRIHLASQNAQIAGDSIYGGKAPLLSQIKRNYSPNKTEIEKAMITRFALHAYSLEFNDVDGENLKIVADYPKDFGVFVKLLKKYDSANY